MDEFKEKYKNCCKFCLTRITNKSIEIGTGELKDVDLIKTLMGDEIFEENADLAKVINNIVCAECAHRLTTFIKFRNSCNEKYLQFQFEFKEAKNAKKFVCEFCFKYYPSEEILNNHKLSHRKPSESEKSFEMEVDESCGQLPADSSTDDETPFFDGHVCKDCNRKFPPEDTAVYLAHCRNLHPKKIHCPYNCLVTPAGDVPPEMRKGVEKRKIFKNLHFLANHIKIKHLNVVQVKTEKTIN